MKLVFSLQRASMPAIPHQYERSILRLAQVARSDKWLAMLCFES